MRKSALKFRTLIIASCLFVVLFIVALIFVSERFTGARNPSANNRLTVNESVIDPKVYADALEKVRNEYAQVKTVEVKADVTVEIVKPTSTISGTGQVTYSAKDNKYRYVCSLSENLVNEGLMRNIEVLFSGDRYYLFDKESKIVSFQMSEETRIAAALPNPFFLPIEYLSNDDDSCDGCKMRLHDVKMPKKWAKRVSSISEISAETENGVHSLIQMPGGDLNKIPYNYRVRLVGESADNLFPISISRVKEDGIPLAEIILNDLRTVQGINTKIPFRIEVVSRDEEGAPALRAVYTITEIKINQSFAEAILAPSFDGAEEFWNSDEKKFVQQ